MNIRKVKVEDLDNLLHLYIAGFKFHYQGRPDVFQDKDEAELKADLMLDLENSNFLVLEVDKTIVGYIMYQIKDKQNHSVMWIEQLFVASEMRKLGYGTALIKEVQRIAKANNCVRLELNCWKFNTNALTMYKQMGFKVQREVLELEI